MNQNIYRAGIIGLGFIGGGDQVSGDRLGQQVADLDGNHCQALSNHPRVRLDDGTAVSCSAEESLRTLEIIVACHASHARHAAWIDLPLSGVDREREVHSA